MNKSPLSFEKVLTALEIEAIWGEPAVTIPKTNFEWDDVPKGLKELVPYAMFWGISDDYVRERLLKRTPSNAEDELEMGGR
jgi:hypothetical protein